MESDINGSPQVCYQDVVSLEPLDDRGVRFTFGSGVTEFSCTISDDPDGGEFCSCEVEAWTSLWDKWFSQGEGTLSTTIPARDGKPLQVMYVPNDGSGIVCIGTNDPISARLPAQLGSGAHTLALPRLALAGYLIPAGTALVILGVCCCSPADGR